MQRRHGPPRALVRRVRALQLFGAFASVLLYSVLTSSEDELVRSADSIPGVSPSSQLPQQHQLCFPAQPPLLRTGVTAPPCVPSHRYLPYRGASASLYPGVSLRSPLLPWYLDPPLRDLAFADRGRVLLLDGFVLDADASTDIQRVWHTPQREESRDVRQLADMLRHLPMSLQHAAALAWDSLAKVYRIWFLCRDASRRCVCASTSEDLFSWAPDPAETVLCVEQNTQLTGNIAVAVDADDDADGGAAARFKLAVQDTALRQHAFVSADGVVWAASGITPAAGGAGGFSIDRTRSPPVYQWHVAQDVYPDVWTHVLYWPSTRWDPTTTAWTVDACAGCLGLPAGAPTAWAFTDAQDVLRPTATWRSVLQLMTPGVVMQALDAAGLVRVRPASTVSFDTVAYESVALALHTILLDPGDERVWLSVSRDPQQWQRCGSRTAAFIGDAQTGRVRVLGGAAMFPSTTHITWLVRCGGIAGTVFRYRLRRDGFASVAGPAVLMTRPLRLADATESRHVFVNADCRDGIGVDVLASADTDAVLASAPAIPVSSTAQHVVSLGSGGQPLIRLRFHLSSPACHLYSFWLSADAVNGASGGWLAAGSPDYPLYQDVIE